VDFLCVSEGIRELATKSSAIRRDVWVFRRLMAGFWTLAIVTMCWLPGELVQRLDDDVFLWKISHFDKIIHCAMFASFSVLWLRAGESRWRYAWVVFTGVGLAALTEIVQALPMVGRQAEMADFGTDLFGIVIGILAASLVEPILHFAEAPLVTRIRPWLAATERTEGG
jgi:hypothetical protein